MSPKTEMRAYLELTGAMVLVGSSVVAGIFLFRVLLLWGLLLTSTAEGGVITSTTPVVVAVISFVFLKERPDARVWAGVTLAVAGIVALNVLGSGAGEATG